MPDELRTQGLSVALDGKPVLTGLSLCFGPGVTSVEGPSGRGKTTLLRALAGLQRPDAGSVSGGAERRIAMVFQEDRLLPWETALANVAAVSDRREAERRLAQVGLAADAHKLPRELSGGMCRRVALARALAFGGEILLLDEPMTGVDEATADAIMAEIRREYAGKIVVLVTHDAAFAARWADARVEL